MVLTGLPGGGPRRPESDLRRLVDERAKQIVRRRRARRVALPIASVALLGIVGIAAFRLSHDNSRRGLSVTSDQSDGSTAEIARSDDRGLSARLTMSPAQPKAGQVIHFTLTVDNLTDVRAPAPDVQWDMVPRVDFGDHRPSTGGLGYSCPGNGPGDSRPRYHTRSTYTYSYAYQEPGAYRVTIAGPAAVGCDFDDRGALAATVSVGGPSSNASNGPVSPYVSVIGAPGASGPIIAGRLPPTELQLFITAGDRDGVVRAVHVRWGDGSKDETLQFRNLSPCKGRPWHDTEDQQSAQHPVKAGATIEMTVESVGCDGKDPQTATVRIPVSSPDNGASALSSPLPSSATRQPG